MRMAKERHSSVCLRSLNSLFQRESNCERCLPKVHFKRKNNGNVRDYDCKNMIYYYCGRFSLKHAGELFTLLQQIRHRLPDNPRILSIGCGPCTDLFAFEAYLKTYKPNKKIEYHGLEKNMLWRDIHDFITKHRKKHNLSRFRITYIDVMSEVQKVEEIIKNEKPSIISFQYVLSDMAKYHPVSSVKRFAEEFVQKAFEILPKSTMIVFNDTNVLQSYAERNPDEVKGRDILEPLANKFWHSRSISVFKYYFPYRNDPSLQFGGAHSKCEVDMGNVPADLKNYFEIWYEYRSAQLVLIKNEDILI